MTAAVSLHLKSGVRQISSTLMAFAALNDEGSVFTWGFSGWGGDSRTIAHRLQSGSARFSPLVTPLLLSRMTVPYHLGGMGTVVIAPVSPHLQSGVEYLL